MILYVFLLGSLLVNPYALNAERQDFKLDDFELESQKWTKPHSDVFSFSEEPTDDNLSELLGTARDTVHNVQLQAAIDTCQSRIATLGQKVKNTDINVQRFIKHLVKIYDESKDFHEGVIFMKITSEDMKALKSFADNGKFSSHTHNNIHDLLRGTVTLPTKSMKDKLLPVMNIFLWIPTAMWEYAMYAFQGIRLLLMQFVFSADLVIYASMFLPVIVLSLSLWRGKSLKASFCATIGMVMVIAYFVELRNAFEVARAKDMARMMRAKNIPPECTGAEIGYIAWVASGFRSMFSSEDRCEKYFREQNVDTTIEVSEVFWKIIFAPLTVAMDKFGYGLRQFIDSFGGNLGWFSGMIIIPVGIIALLLFLALLGAFLTGGFVAVPYFGKISFRNPLGHRDEPVHADAPPHQPTGNTPPQPAITNVYNYNLFNSSHPSPSHITAPPNFNLAITAPNGPTLQLTTSPSPDNSIPSSSLNPSGQSSAIAAGPHQSGHSSAIAAGPHQSGHSSAIAAGPHQSGHSLAIAAGPHQSGQSSAIAAGPHQSGQSSAIAAGPHQSGQFGAIAAGPHQSGQSSAIAAGPARKKLSQRTISSPAGSLEQQQLTGFNSRDTSRGLQHPVADISETDNRCFFSNVDTNFWALAENGSGDLVDRDLTYRNLPSGRLRYRHHRKLSL